MMREPIRTDAAPAPVGPYSQAIVATGRMVFVSGQIPLDPQTGEIVGEGDIAAQTERAIVSLTAILKAAGASLADVVKTTVYLKNMNDFAAMNAVYMKHFGETAAPARAAIEVARLPKDVLVEIDCIAVLAE